MFGSSRVSSCVFLTPKLASILVKMPAVKVVSAFLIIPSQPAVKIAADQSKTPSCTNEAKQGTLFIFVERGLAFGERAITV